MNGGGMSRIFVWPLLLTVLCSCAATRPPAPSSPSATARWLATDPVRSEAAADLIAALPAAGGDIVRRHLADGPESSVFLIRIRGAEEPHRHRRYDLTVFLIEGEGTLWLDGRPLDMRQGDIAHIPRDVPHHFVNTGNDAASAVAVFSPRFTDPDSEPYP